MSNTVTKVREPLIRISKRASIVWWKAWLIRAAAIILAFLLCAVIIVLMTGQNPIAVYGSLFAGNFGSKRKIMIMIHKTAILLCIALGVTPAFKMKFWNIGAEGQVLMGCMASAACMIYLGDKLPTALMVPVTLVASMAAGVLWSVIPAIFKAKWNTNETLFTLMLNYVATQLVAYAITFWENPSGSNSVGIINPNSQGGWMPVIGGQKYLLNILVVAVLTIVMYIYLMYSKHGYEISVVGESQNTARYIGIDVKKVIIRTMIFTGCIMGLIGMMIVAGTDHTISVDTVGGQGFTAIMVSWLAKFNPIFMTFTSFLLIFMQRGASEIATTFRLNESVADVLTGVILFFIIGCEFFINYKINFRHAHKEGK